jgi:AcrR family transcriptional regulator
MVRPTKKEQIPNLPEAIKDTAWDQIAKKGAAALSLRAIARELGITAPAIYNHFHRRDDLVTALIIDAYISFGDWQLQARDSVPIENLPERLKAIGLAYRNWALTYPQRYQLIFGTPIPGYESPMEQVMPYAARSLSALVSVIEALRLIDRLKVPTFPEINPANKINYQVWEEHFGDTDLSSRSVATLIWARVHGIVSLEIGGNLPPYVPDSGDLYLYEIDTIANQFIKP